MTGREHRERSVFNRAVLSTAWDFVIAAAAPVYTSSNMRTLVSSELGEKGF